MRVGKIHSYSGANDLNPNSSNVPIPDNSNYTTVFKYVPTGVYYERLSTGAIKPITCDCVNQKEFGAVINQVGLAVPTVFYDVINEFPAPPVWQYNGVGSYSAIFPGNPLTSGKTLIDLQQPNRNFGFASVEYVSAGQLDFWTQDPAGVPSDTILKLLSLRILVVN